MLSGTVVCFAFKHRIAIEIYSLIFLRHIWLSLQKTQSDFTPDIYKGNVIFCRKVLGGPPTCSDPLVHFLSPGSFLLWYGFTVRCAVLSKVCLGVQVSYFEFESSEEEEECTSKEPAVLGMLKTLSTIWLASGRGVRWIISLSTACKNGISTELVSVLSLSLSLS